MKKQENQTEWKKVNLWIAVPVIMQIAIAAMMLWGYFGHAWGWSWLCAYAGVVLCLELYMYNNVLDKGKHPFNALYPIVIMLGFAFFFTLGFAANGWSYSWIGLAAAAVAVCVLIGIDKAVISKKK